MGSCEPPGRSRPAAARTWCCGPPSPCRPSGGRRGRLASCASHPSRDEEVVVIAPGRDGSLLDRLLDGAPGLVGVAAVEAEAALPEVRTHLAKVLGQVNILVLAPLARGGDVPQTELTHSRRVDDGAA